MSLIKGYPSGSDITLINTIFQRSEKGQDGKWGPEVLTVIFRDNRTGEKKFEEFKDPEYRYYVCKDEYKESYPRLFLEKDKLIECYCKNKDILKDIASRTGNLDFFYDNISSGNNRANSVLHQHPDIFNSDSNIEDHYRARFSEEYTNRSDIQITKAFFDIEADTRTALSDFPEMGECPINAVTIIFRDNNQVFTFLLRDKTNPLILQFEESVKDKSIFPEIINFIMDNVGGIEKYKSFGLSEYKYNILFYNEDEEIKLIYDVFNCINSYKPDFVEAWNMAFDIPYIIARIEILGYNPVDIMCSRDFKHKSLYYYIDQRVLNEYAERGDYANISSYSVYMDQMIQFASRRKSQKVFSSFALDNIGSSIAKVRKLNYKHITDRLEELPIKDYKTFVLYNIFDTIVQNCIEQKTQDLEYVFSKCNINNTRYSKCHRQTVYLTNRGAKSFSEQGFIIGNNQNRGTSEPTTKYPGAFVADPLKTNDISKLRINGVPCNVYDNLVDFDYSALYPSLIRELNIAPNTIIGCLEIPRKIFENENKTGSDKWSRAGQFIEDLQSHVWVEFAHRWFNLPTYKELYNDIVEYFTKKIMPNNILREVNSNGLINAMEFYDKVISDPMVVNSSKKNIIYPIYLIKKDETEKKIEEWKRNVTEIPNQQFTSDK